jgi:hypothetical protein
MLSLTEWTKCSDFEESASEKVRFREDEDDRFDDVADGG